MGTIKNEMIRRSKTAPTSFGSARNVAKGLTQRTKTAAAKITKAAPNTVAQSRAAIKKAYSKSKKPH